MIFIRFTLLCLVLVFTWYHAILPVIILFDAHAMLFILDTFLAFVSDSTLKVVGNELLVLAPVFEAVQEDTQIIQEWTANDMI